MRRTKAEDHATMRTCTTETGELSYVTALNLSSYNYLGFAETDLEMRDEVPIFGLMISHRSLDLRIFVQVIASMRRYGVSSVGSRTEVIISLNFFGFRSFWKWHRIQFNICVLEIGFCPDGLYRSCESARGTYCEVCWKASSNCIR